MKIEKFIFSPKDTKRYLSSSGPGPGPGPITNSELKKRTRAYAIIQMHHPPPTMTQLVGFRGGVLFFYFFELKSVKLE